jgi:hypothetical protein
MCGPSALSRSADKSSVRRVGFAFHSELEVFKCVLGMINRSRSCEALPGFEIIEPETQRSTRAGYRLRELTDLIKEMVRRSGGSRLGRASLSNGRRPRTPIRIERTGEALTPCPPLPRAGRNRLLQGRVNELPARCLPVAGGNSGGWLSVSSKGHRNADHGENHLPQSEWGSVVFGRGARIGTIVCSTSTEPRIGRAIVSHRGRRLSIGRPRPSA